ncbi:hypothetical protein MMC09_004674 [Bachmanniomyces sp. S44760]|nr:hypothetical protein [Bachmanniomyces sp. S44760]
MASALLLRRPILTPLTIGASSFFFAQSFSRPYRRHVLCDSYAGGSLSDSFRTYSTDARVPVIENGRPNPKAYGQITSGSILGLLGGLAVSTFSKSLAFLIGLGVWGVQFAASRGYNIVPTSKLQQYVKGIDLKSAVEDNVAFKLSFGVTFMLAAFAHF